MEGRDNSHPTSHDIFANFDESAPQQPGAGESQNPIPAPFYAQGSQPPRAVGNRRARVQQNRYAVPTTMHYSESSQAEAGQQIDRLRHMNQPVPSALFSENPEPSSNPSNSQNFGINNNDIHNEQTILSSENAEDIFQQMANGQQDSAQPGVPPTYHPTVVHETPSDSSYFNDDDTHETNQSNRDYAEEEKEEGKEFNPRKHENQSHQERQGVEDIIRPNHQEEMQSEGNQYIHDENPYKNVATRKNEQFSPVEKGCSGLEMHKRITPRSRRQSNSNKISSFEKTEDKKTSQPFGYNINQKASSNYASFVVPSSYSEKMSLYNTQQTPESSKLTSAYLQLNHSRNSENRSSNPHTESVSSFPVTNYEDSEFMIQAYQRKKKAYENWKQKLLQIESDLHMEKQRCKMYQEENKRFKLSIRKMEQKYKSLVQANAKQE